MKRYKRTLILVLRYARAAMAWAISAALVIQPTLVYALPTGGTVVGGEANIVAGNSSLTVNQTTQRALINWTGFDIDGGESVHFNQPGASSISLNRVNSASASQINGSLSSNGQVWIINQNGVMFGQGAQVNVGGLLVSTAGISDDNFMNGNYQFNIAGNPNAAIINDGNISVADAGVASLVAPVVRNNGVIQAKLGTVNLASGDTFALDLYGDGLISVEASAALQQQLVSNSGLIEANGGSVLLTAAAAGDVVDSLINMDGVIRANSIGEKNGTVVLYAEGSNAVKGNIAADKGQKQGVSTVLVSGTIEAKGKAAGEKGGNIDVLGDHVGVMSGGFIDASGQIGGGKIRIGGDYFGGGDTPTALKTLVQRNTTIKANAIESGDGGRITIWSDDTTWFGGSIEAKGGAISGNGGFVEVSGKEYLAFKGAVDTRAENGETGLLLLDPADIVIASGSGDSAADGNNTFSGDPSGTIGTILSGDTGPSTIYESELEGLGANTNISLAATNSITINNLADNNLNLAQDGGNSVTFTAGGGGFNMNTGDTITTAGGAINIVTTGGTSTIGSLASNGGIITLNMGGDITVSGVISGTGTALTKTGTGTVLLSNANTYTGNTTITDGIIDVGHNNALGTGTLVMNGGGLRDDGALRTLANNISVTANNSAIGGSAGMTFNGTMTFEGEHALNNYNGGTVTFGNVNLSNSASDQLVTFANHGSDMIINGVIANGGTSTASSIRKNGAGTLILNGNNTFAGGLNIAAGTLTVGHNNAAGTGILTLNGGTLTASGSRTLANNVDITNDSAIAGSSAIQFDGTFGNSNGTRYLDVSNSATTTFGNINISSDGSDRFIIFTGSGNSVVNGVVANGGGSTSSGIGLVSSGSLTLNGNNTYGGNFYHDGGTLILGHDNALGTANFLAYGGTIQGTGGTRTIANNISYWDDTTFAGSTALVFNGDFYNTNNLTVTNNNSATTTFSNVDLSYDASNYTLTFGGTGNTVVGGVISNGGGGSTTSAITKIGSGTLSLNNANTYGGTTTLTAGTIEVGHNNALGTGTLSLNGGTLQGDGVARTLANAVTLAANSTIGGSSALQFDGTFGNLTADRTLTVNNSATTTFDDINISSSATDRTLTIGGTGDTAVSGVIANGSTSTASGINKTGNGTLTLSGNNTYAGDTTINGGTLRLGAANRLANTTDIVIGASGTFDMDGYNETVATITNGGAITMGTGNTLTTTGAQTHTGSISGTDISIIASTGNLTFDTISANTLFAQAVAGDIILNDQITAAANAGTSITLVADDQFINNHGATALQTAGTARWLVYSEDSAANTRGSLAGFNRYGCTYNAGSPDCAAGTSTPATGNGFYFVQAPTITITGLTANNKVYDGNTTATLAGTATVNGAINGDTVTLDASGVTATFDTKDVGNGKTVTIAGFTNAMGYLVTQPAAVLANITAKALTIAGLTANNKTYDGNTTATLSGTGSLVGVVGAETVGFNMGTATFDNPNVGTNKSVTGAGFSLTGADMGNYSLTQPSWFADITAAAGGGGGGGSVSSGNQSTINAILSLLGLLGNNAMTSGTSAGGTFQFTGGIPEPARMEILPVEEKVPTSGMTSKPVHDHNKVDPLIEINAMIDLTGLLKDRVETDAGKQVAADAKPQIKANPEAPRSKDEKSCNSLLGNAVCASKIFSTVGVPNI